MIEKTRSEGKCLFCGKTFTKAGINRHLQQHLKERVTKNKAGKSFLLKIGTPSNWGGAPYFLSLWVDGEAMMEDIDSFLRAIWLECCGHASSFANPKNKRQGAGMEVYFEAEELLEVEKIKTYEKRMAELTGRIPMDQKTKLVCFKGLKLEYEYDYGSSTELEVTIVDEYPSQAEKVIVLLSRNEPLELMCEICESEPATQICAAHGWEDPSEFCPKCAKKHAKICKDFDDYAAMPIVNSPRMGVCAYTGGQIDIERDGVFVNSG